MAFLVKMKSLIAKCEEDRSLLLNPDLNFLRQYIVGLGGEVAAVTEKGDGDGDGDDDDGDDGGNMLSEWLDKFISSTIVHPGSGEILLEIKSLSDGSESKYLTYFTEGELIGYGGSGLVYSCVSKMDRQCYAVKKIPIKNDFNNMLREIIAFSSLNHPNIVRYFQTWVESELLILDYNGKDEQYEVDDYPLTKREIRSPWLYILMEYCTRSLSKMLSDPHEPRWDRTKSLELIREILSAVDYIHQSGYLHGDLAAANIFLDDSDHAKVGDFGKCRQIGEDGLVSVSNADAHKFYKAPELIKGKTVDSKVDIFSLGVVFGELLHPFGTAMERIHILSAFKNVNEFPSEWTDDEFVLRKMTSLNAKDRPSAARLLADFGDFFSSE